METIRNADGRLLNSLGKTYCCSNLTEYQSYKENKRQAESAAKQAAQEIIDQIQKKQSVSWPLSR